MAGVQTAVALREQGWTGPLTVIGEEPHEPYDRPPLSKGLLLGKADALAFDIDFSDLDIELLLGCRAVALRTEEREVVTTGRRVPYDCLVLATGAEPIPLPGSQRGSGRSGGHLLRTLDDAVALQPVLEDQRDVVVVGAGWIGAEFATAARAAGCRVTVVEAADQPLPGQLPAEVAMHMRPWYAAAGARLRTGSPVTAVEPGAVLLADGTRLAAEAVVAGIGARPATGWLAGSGVKIGADASVVADDRLRTTVPDVYAVGDCASFPSARYGRRLLVHHWDNAARGARVVAANLLGEDVRHNPVPYFWSEQFGRFVQYAGYHTGADELLWRGDPAGSAWSVCWLRDGVLVALLAVGRPRDLAQGRKLIERGAGLYREKAADPSVPLKSATS